MQKRREFISLLGKGIIGSVIIPPFLQSCSNSPNKVNLANTSNADLDRLKQFAIKGMAPSSADEVILAEGLDYKVLLQWEDKISQNDTFGFNNDFTCFVPFDKNNPDDGLLLVNHEYPHPLFISQYNSLNKKHIRTVEQVDKEMYSVGVSIVRIKKDNGRWKFMYDDPYNRRITAKTPIPFNWKEPIWGSNEAMGTHSNCSGGLTPWGTVLTCEENADQFYSDTPIDSRMPRKKSVFQWEQFYNYPAEHYGWVVEVDPFTGQAQKHAALGRFAHECCTLIQLKGDRIVAYTGDDKMNEFVYKFISSKPNSLTEGTLYVANTEQGKWLSLKYEEQPVLQQHFHDQTDVLIHARKAARLVGATPQNRPEDIEIDPIDGSVLISMTNNELVDDDHGAILKIIETKNQHDSLTFKSEVFLTGGPESGFTCPDNLAFDLSGNLYFTSDITGSKINKLDGPYGKDFKNNGLYVVPRYGKRKGEVIQIASAPVEAEFSGPWFSPDYKTLFLSVQHPGEMTYSMDNLTSNWPHNEDKIPRPSVITIQGDLLNKLTRLHELEEKG